MASSMDTSSSQHGAAMLDIGSRFEDRDLQAYGLMLQGIGLVSQAKVEQACR